MRGMKSFGLKSGGIGAEGASLCVLFWRRDCDSVNPNFRRDQLGEIKVGTSKSSRCSSCQQFGLFLPRVEQFGIITRFRLGGGL